MKIDLEQRYRTLLTLWFALLMSVGSFFLFATYMVPDVIDEPGKTSSSSLILALTAFGMFLVIVSFVVKQKLLKQSVEKQDVALVQISLVVACAMCEVSALLGLIERFVVGNRYYYLLFLIAAFGIAFHFPRREHLLAASYKTLTDRANF